MIKTTVVGSLISLKNFGMPNFNVQSISKPTNLKTHPGGITRGKIVTSEGVKTSVICALSENLFILSKVFSI